MCWSPQVSVAMVGGGVAATAVTYMRRDPPAIWLTLAYFTVMEGLQVLGYRVINQCGTPSNRTVTMLSYFHIVCQPIFINAFAMELVSTVLKRRVRMWVYSACCLSALVMLAQIVPWPNVGACLPGTVLCAADWCTVPGEWHIAWEVPYNGVLVGLERVFGTSFGFPSYMLAAFVLPLLYGAWRFVLMHAVTGPMLALALTRNPDEMPAVWCLFSIFILLIGLSPMVRRSFTARTWWGKTVHGSG